MSRVAKKYKKLLKHPVIQELINDSQGFAAKENILTIFLNNAVEVQPTVIKNRLDVKDVIIKNKKMEIVF